jgi:chaperonin GroES
VKLRPIGERALVEIEAREEKTASGIVLPETAKDKPQTARVVAVGDMENGSVGEGDLVVFARFAGAEIKQGEQEHLILDAEDLLGIVEE